MSAVVIRFVAIGPAVGTLAFIFASELGSTQAAEPYTIAAAAAILQDTGSLVAMWLYGLVLGYPVGCIPAVLCGIVYAFCLERVTSGNPKRISRFAAGATIGGLLSVGFGSLFTWVPSAANVFTSLVAWATSGAAAGGFSALAITEPLYQQVHGQHPSSAA
jgi:hypothetical protein